MPASSVPSGFCGLYWKSTLANVRRHVLRVATVARVAVCHARDDDVAHLDDQELLLALAGLAMGDRRFLQVHTRRARLHQHRRRLVDVVGEGEVVEARLALPASASAPHLTGVRHAPRPAQHLDLALVLVVQRFALDVADLREDVRRHNEPPLLAARALMDAVKAGYIRVPTATRYSFSKRARSGVPRFHSSQNRSSASTNSASRSVRRAFA